MNGLHDLLDKLKKLEEAAAAPTTFTPQYYHERNIGPIMPVMMTDPGVFWYEASETPDPEMGGRSRGAGAKTIQRLYGDPNARGITAVGSVDGKLVSGKPVPFGPGETWQTDLEKARQAQQAQQAQQAKATADANTAAKAAKVKQFTDLLVKAGVYTAPTTPTASAGSSIGNYSLSKAGSNSGTGIKLPTQEGIVFKSRIGQLLADSGALKGITVSDALKSLTEASALSKAEYSLLSKLYGELKVEYPDDAQLVPLLMAYDKVAPVYSSDPAAQTNNAAVAAGGASSGDAGVANNASSGYYTPTKNNAGGMGSGTSAATLNIPGVDTVADIAAQVAAVPGKAGDRAGGISSTSTSTEPAAEKKSAVLPQAVTDLAKTNGIDDPNKISAGKEITLADGTKYTIVAGDTLADIAAGKFKGKVLPKGDAAKADTSLSGQNQATTKSKLTPDEIAAAKEALADPSISARDKAYYTELLKNQPGSGDAAKEAPKTRYKTPEEYDKEIARFSSKYDMKLKANQQYIANLEAEKAQLINRPASATGDTANPDRPGLDPKKGKPEVYDRQKQLAALGAKMKDGTTPLGLDGVNGNDTIAAEKEFGRLIIDPKTTIVVNGAPRVVNANDIKNIQSWIKAVKAGKQKMDQVPAVYMDIVKKQSAMKESTGYTNDELNRLVSLVHHR
jgi:hypothetical protein